jgi:hypothetical protein
VTNELPYFSPNPYSFNAVTVPILGTAKVPLPSTFVDPDGDSTKIVISVAPASYVTISTSLGTSEVVINPTSNSLIGS